MVESGWEFTPVTDRTLPPQVRRGRRVGSGFLIDTPEAIRAANDTGWGTACYSLSEAQLERLRNGQLLYLNDGEYVTLIRLVRDRGEGGVSRG